MLTAGLQCTYIPKTHLLLHVQVYKQLAGEDSVSLERSPHNVRNFSIQNLAGDYRRLVQRPRATAWRLLRYGAPDAELATVPPEGEWMVMASRQDRHGKPPTVYGCNAATASGPAACAHKAAAAQHFALHVTNEAMAMCSGKQCLALFSGSIHSYFMLCTCPQAQTASPSSRHLPTSTRAATARRLSHQICLLARMSARWLCSCGSSSRRLCTPPWR